MKYCRKLWPLLGLVVLLLYSCEQDDGTFENDSGNMSYHPFVQETRAYFEDYVSMEMEFETWGMHPGLIAPDWDKAKIFTQSGTMSVDVPLWTEASYEGSFYMRNDSSVVSSTDTYYTAILQKLIVVKSLEKDAFSCYIATIIPDAEHATRNSSRIEGMFYGGDTNSKFSGTVMYSTVTTNYTIAVERYKEGMLCEEVSLFYASADVSDDYEAMIRLINAKNIQRSVRVMTRNGEMGGGGIMLPEVVIPGHRPDPTPPPSLPPPPSPPPPLPPLPPVPNPPVVPPPPTAGGGSQSGGGSSSTTPYVDKLYGTKSNLSAADKKKLEKELTELINQNKFFKLLFTLLVDGKVKLNFKIDSKLDGVANGKYDSGTQTILFANSLAVNSVTLREELVHAVQHNIVYGADAEKLVNKFNLELEAHLFPDMAYAIIYGTFTLNGSHINTASYPSNSFTNTLNALMNSIIQNKGFSESQFFLYKELAKNWKPKSYGGSYLESLPPKFLYEIFKK
ncbi:hypothetical protein [uncultured Bacteroides sp.]|uniref:hypothetical protein n=1 Tax=uncultured Bacteroides sp. TaxID=162156 RepID=UPI0025ECA939|nr:hypothetical protein [uncultured Bacteroides sp.]